MIFLVGTLLLFLVSEIFSQSNLIIFRVIFPYPASEQSLQNSGSLSKNALILRDVTFALICFSVFFLQIGHSKNILVIAYTFFIS